MRRSSPMTASTQDKQKEIAFFDGHAAADDYDVFTPQASARLVDAFVKLTRLNPGARAIDTFPLLPPRGRFLASDRKRMIPCMWLYRTRASPFYSPVGVTPNERPVLAREVHTIFARAGFAVTSHYLSGLAYRYVASR